MNLSESEFEARMRSRYGWTGLEVIELRALVVEASIADMYKFDAGKGAIGWYCYEAPAPLLSPMGEPVPTAVQLVPGGVCWAPTLSGYRPGKVVQLSDGYAIDDGGSLWIINTHDGHYCVSSGINKRAIEKLKLDIEK